MPLQLTNALSAMLTFASICPSITAAQQRGGLPQPAEIVFPIDPVEMPMRQYEKLPVIEIMIDGQGPFNMVLDTGASVMLINESLAETLALASPPGMPGSRIQVMSPSGPIDAGLHIASSINIQGIRITDSWLIATELPFGEAIDGVIGINFFKDALLTFDYLNSTVRIHKGALPPTNDSDIFDYITAGDSGTHPRINMKVDDEPLEFLIDTGYRGWFMATTDWVAQLGFIDGPIEGQMGLTAGGPISMNIARIDTAISLGQYSVNKPTVRFLSDTPMGAVRVVGSSFLEHFCITFDGINRRVCFANGPQAPITPPAVHYMGIGVRQVGSHLEVWAVHPLSEANELGIEVGDHLISINEVPASEFYNSAEGKRVLSSPATISLIYSKRGDDNEHRAELPILQLLPALE